MSARHPDGRDDTLTRPGGTDRGEHPAVDTTRPFGAHLRMAWWKPVVLVVLVPLAMVLLNIVFYLVAGLVEGSDDPLSATLTPWKLLAANLSIAASGLLAVVLLVWLTGVPWRRLITLRRRFDGRRLARYLIASALLMGTAGVVVRVVAPEAAGQAGFAVTTTTIVLLAITVLSTPLQSLGEELMFRSVLLPAAASWVRAVRPALAVGLVVSSVVFALSHGSTDPWLAGYFVVFSMSAGLLAIVSGGMEAPIAHHVANNVVAGIVNALFAGGDTPQLDRSAGAGDASLLVLMVGNVAVVGYVWLRERRLRQAGRTS